MRKHLLLWLPIFLLGCGTGDLQIETIDFDQASVQYCGTLNTETTLLFKLNGTEALVLQLAPGLLRNEASAGALESSIPGQSKLTYRIFDSNATASHFCDAIPPAAPAVLEDISAQSGAVLVTTVQDPVDSTRFEHTIALSGITLVNSKGERLSNLSLTSFGTVATTSN
ncbi:hypothetical protein OZ410_08830 [Robiginitalea sp. M366]|uniref:hypothetical protein n=1 Tax=Robiginitalea aestuariiviva TaxID=3036903 RepID=UPI00240D80F2|nr:hypothetical protein [Robiginitalea aestuariiviva]MDG1572419.1 hypothetical protein [Robiginitalea aestuariiviva]